MWHQAGCEIDLGLNLGANLPQARSYPLEMSLFDALGIARHTFASLLIDSGANPKAIQQFMGHSKIQTTFDVYGHLLPGSHDEVRKRMDAYLRGDGA